MNKMIKNSSTTAAAFALALAAAGCESTTGGAGGRTGSPQALSVGTPRTGLVSEKIPADARLVAEAERANSVVYNAPEPGRLYVYSETENRLITTLDVNEGERIELAEVDLSNPQPPLFRLSKGGQQVIERDGRPLVVQFYFQPLPAPPPQQMK